MIFVRKKAANPSVILVYMNTGFKKVKSSRTILDFSFAGDVHPILEKWASENSFFIRKSSRGVIKYRRSGGVMMPPVMLQIKQSDKSVHLETWLQVDILTEFTTLFNAPAQSAIDSSAKGLWREREIARLHVNKLLKEFGQPPIK
jgi:hypothetical protein